MSAKPNELQFEKMDMGRVNRSSHKHDLGGESREHLCGLAPLTWSRS